MKEKITLWYKQGLWTILMVHNAVEKGIITENDFIEITGESY